MAPQLILTAEQLADIDEPCRSLVAAMNRLPGIRTTESCCGHGKEPFAIWFAVEFIEDLPAICYWADACHSGVGGWVVAARTDCAMSPVSFMVKSTETGKYAYQEAEQIAARINEWLDGIEQEEGDESDG